MRQTMKSSGYRWLLRRCFEDQGRAGKAGQLLAGSNQFVLYAYIAMMPNAYSACLAHYDCSVERWSNASGHSTRRGRGPPPG